MMFDAHNHLQDVRLRQTKLDDLSIAGAVVNGTSEQDWPTVLELAEKHRWIVPSLGLHPWFVNGRSSDWKNALVLGLDSRPCAIGEIGLDRWIENPDLPAQEEAFAFQLSLAAERKVPASIHCLKSWGRLDEMLRASPLPQCGFLLHSYNGPVEMLRGFLDLGAHVSISGYFANPQKLKQRETFRAVPLDRVLVETDAPDMLLPEHLEAFSLKSEKGERLNHPGNLAAVYRFAAELYRMDLERFTACVGENFQRLFGTLLR